jgi:hypothetical protein
MAMQSGLLGGSVSTCVGVICSPPAGGKSSKVRGNGGAYTVA